MEIVLALLGLGIVALTLGAILWSIFFPAHRFWPPKHYTMMTPFIVWVPTFTLFGILIVLGIMGWGDISSPGWLRYGIGVPLILFGNIAVWTEVAHFGVAQTGGAKGSLRTDGLYRYSRNPQYLADVAIISGWMLLSSAPLAIAVGLAAILVLVAAPFAEEPWLRNEYGEDYERYLSKTRRFL